MFFTHQTLLKNIILCNPGSLDAKCLRRFYFRSSPKLMLAIKSKTYDSTGQRIVPPYVPFLINEVPPFVIFISNLSPVTAPFLFPVPQREPSAFSCLAINRAGLDLWRYLSIEWSPKRLNKNAQLAENYTKNPCLNTCVGEIIV